MRPLVRPAATGDLPRVFEVRHGTAENPLSDPSLVTQDEVLWYLEKAIFLVAEDDAGVVQGFTCVNHQTAYVWALFVIDGRHGEGFGTALTETAAAKLRALGHRQMFLTTGKGTRAEGFYRSRGFAAMGEDLKGEIVYRRLL